MKAEQNSPVGSLKISRDVIAAIASQAAKEIDGVHSLAAAPVDIKGIFSKSRPAFKPVSITINDDIVEIDLRLVLNGQAHIPTVAQRVQEAVKESVQSMTGITVSKVNVAIAQAHFENGETTESV